MSTTLARLLTGLPDGWPGFREDDLRAAIAASGRKIVVLDDDPTGTQTVHDIPVLTGWGRETLATELSGDTSAFYVLTNSRSLPADQAAALGREIGQNLAEAGRQTGQSFCVISRSDSTLRGHFPAETDALAEGLGERFDATLLLPAFFEGGRYTIDDIHYVSDGDDLIPAAETDFARDAAFGYRASHLRDWVVEKTQGRVPAEDIRAISLQDIRVGGPACVADRLAQIPMGGVGVINAATRRDLEVFTLGLLSAESRGPRYLYRTAASFAPVRAGIAPRSLLTPDDLTLGAGGGLTVVGSYVAKTTQQLSHLRDLHGLVWVEVDVVSLLAEAHRGDEISRAMAQVEQGLQAGRDVVLFTERDLVLGADAAESLAIGKRISEGITAIVSAVSTRPRYLLVKGGITSSDIAVRSLGVRRAVVQGQILPGVPVWRLGAESRFPGLPYLVFPGNVGGPQSLCDLVGALRKKAA